MVLHVMLNRAAGAGAERSLERLLDHRSHDAVFDIQTDRTLPASLFALFKLLRRGEHRCVVAWSYWGIAFVELLSLLVGGRSYRIVWNIRQSFRDPQAIRWKTRWVVYALGYLSGKRHKIYNSADAREAHSPLWGGRGTHVIQNGYEVQGVRNRYQPTAPSHRGVRIGFIARNHGQKDPELFFKIMSALSRQGVEVSVFGAGYSARDKALYSEMAAPVPVRFHGYCDSDSIYRQIDLAVLTSRTEGFPNVVAEAILHMVPVFAPPVGDVDVMLSPDFVFNSRDAQACAQQIEGFLARREEAKHAAFDACFKRISQFDIARMTGLYAEVLD